MFRRNKSPETLPSRNKPTSKRGILGRTVLAAGLSITPLAALAREHSAAAQAPIEEAAQAHSIEANSVIIQADDCDYARDPATGLCIPPPVTTRATNPPTTRHTYPPTTQRTNPPTTRHTYPPTTQRTNPPTAPHTNPPTTAPRPVPTQGTPLPNPNTAPVVTSAPVPTVEQVTTLPLDTTTSVLGTTTVESTTSTTSTTVPRASTTTSILAAGGITNNFPTTVPQEVVQAPVSHNSHSEWGPIVGGGAVVLLAAGGAGAWALRRRHAVEGQFPSDPDGAGPTPPTGNGPFDSYPGGDKGIVLNPGFGGGEPGVGPAFPVGFTEEFPQAS